MSGASADAAAAFRSRLFFTLVEDVLAQAEIELVEVKSVRFLAEYPWTPGKRLRPITFLLANFSVRLERGVSLESNGRESRLAAAIELLHEASLVHDDLVDGSSLRRGSPTMHMMNGQGLALLIGDYMVFRGLKLILDAAESRDDIVLAKELANTGLAIAQGEADQLDRYLRNPGWDERMSMNSYLDLIAKKTAAFFAGCAEAGAALAGASPGLREVYREFGMNMGLVFQMVDDLMDVLGEPDVAMKTLRHNLAEGTVTLPMIHAWELDPTFPPLRRLAAGEHLGARAEAALYRRLATPDVLGRCRVTMDEYAAKSMACTASMPVGIFRHGLVDLLEYVRQCSWGGLDARLGTPA